MPSKTCKCGRETGSTYFAALPDGEEVCFFCYDEYRAEMKKQGVDVPPAKRKSKAPRA